MANKRIKKKRAKAVKTKAIRRNNKSITRGQEYYQNISSAYIKKMSDAQLFKAIYNAAATINERLKKIKKSEKNVTSVFKFTDLYTGIQQIEKKYGLTKSGMLKKSIKTFIRKSKSHASKRSQYEQYFEELINLTSKSTTATTIKNQMKKSLSEISGSLGKDLVVAYLKNDPDVLNIIEKMLRKELPPEAYINGLYDGDIATEVSRDMNRGEKVTLEELKNLILEKNKINVPNYSTQSSEIEWTEQNTENVQNNNWSNVKQASEDFLKNIIS